MLSYYINYYYAGLSGLVILNQLGEPISLPAKNIKLVQPVNCKGSSDFVKRYDISQTYTPIKRTIIIYLELYYYIIIFAEINSQMFSE
jgi:hypothetical protein